MLSKKYEAVIQLLFQMIEENKTLLKENKVLRQLLEWAYECDFGLDQIAADDDFDFDKFYKETKGMGYIESMLLYTERWMDKNEPGWRS